MIKAINTHTHNLGDLGGEAWMPQFSSIEQLTTTLMRCTLKKKGGGDERDLQVCRTMQVKLLQQFKKKKNEKKRTPPPKLKKKKVFCQIYGTKNPAVFSTIRPHLYMDHS